MNTWNHLYKSKKKITKKYTKILVAADILPEMTTIIILFLLGLSVIEGSGTIGDFNYYQGIIGQVIASLYMIIYNYGQIYDGKIRINNYLNFIHFENKVRDEGKIILNKSDFEIEFRNVSFKYKENSNFTLENLNFKLNCNQKIALVGVNGSGKTSIIKLLLRFYDPNEGVRDFNVDDESFELIRKQFKDRKLDLVIDYEHQTLSDVQAPAGGWIKDLYKGEDAIIAKVEWTPKAAEYLKNKEYRYLSPVVLVRKRDQKATAIHSVALTNTPAIDGMFALVNSLDIEDISEG